MYVVVHIGYPPESGLVDQIEKLDVYGPYPSKSEATKACPEDTEMNYYFVEPMRCSAIPVEDESTDRA